MRLVYWPDLRLETPATSPPAGFDYAALFDGMLEIMRRHGGVGLAAPQVGVNARAFVIQVPGGAVTGDKPLLCVEPTWWTLRPDVVLTPEGANIAEIKDPGSQSVQLEEGCLSFPGVTETKTRWDRVCLRYVDHTTLEEVMVVLEGTEAQAAQHELEHLDGVTFARGWKPARRDVMRRKIAKAVKNQGRTR